MKPSERGAVPKRMMAIQLTFILAGAWRRSISFICLIGRGGPGTIAALDRIVGRGSDSIAGLWASLAFLAGGWPPLALIALATVVVGRREAGLTPKLIVPPLLTALAWLAWALEPGADRSLGRVPGAAVDAEVGVVPGARRLRAGASLEPLGRTRGESLGPRRVVAARAIAGPGLAPGCRRVAGRRHGGAGPRPGRADARAWRAWPSGPRAVPIASGPDRSPPPPAADSSHCPERSLRSGWVW